MQSMYKQYSIVRLDMTSLYVKNGHLNLKPTKILMNRLTYRLLYRLTNVRTSNQSVKIEK